MFKHILIIGMLIFSTLIGSNRVSQQKAIVTTNYIMISAVEQINIQNLFNAVSFYIPSENYSGEVFNHRPYINNDGKNEVFLGDMLDENNIVLDNIKNLNNNYLFNFSVSYNNTTKKVDIDNKIREYGKLDTSSIFLQDGTKTNVFQVR